MNRQMVFAVVVTVIAAFLGASASGFANEGEEAIEKVAEQAEAANEALGEKRFFRLSLPDLEGMEVQWEPDLELRSPDDRIRVLGDGRTQPRQTSGHRKPAGAATRGSQHLPASG